jgi:energy-coupling factor transporter ATP-binding protein EcfA2
MASRAGIGDLMRTWFSHALLSRGGILLHATAVIRAGKALVFSGPSASGKTTLARLAGHQPVLSDESVAITRGPRGRRGRAVFYAHGTPFFGELVDAIVNESAPIGEVFLIRPPGSTSIDNSFRVADVSPSRSMAELLSQTFIRVLSPNSLNIVLSWLDEFIGSVRIRRLDFAPAPEIWKFIDDQSE